MSHTPGPWTVQPVKGSFQVPFHIVSVNGKPVAYCEGQQLRPDQTSTGESRANARLIAAAPELLAVCKAISSDLELFPFAEGEYHLSEQSVGVILQSLREVIAKAEEWLDDGSVNEAYMGPDGYTFRIEESLCKYAGNTVQRIYELHGTNSKTGYTWLAGEFNTRSAAREAITRQRQADRE
jgi:hypothetical protein